MTLYTVLYSGGYDCKHLEKSRSWPSAHDWKSCIPQKGIEGSNPSFSAKAPFVYGTKGAFFFC